MNDEQASSTGGLSPEYHNYDKQRCFVGHSLDAPWREDLITMCSEVLPDFELEPWYAADHFTPTKSLREKVVELIANTRYGIYDLSYWRKDDKSEWQMPRNVFIELGIAIALNRPMLLLRHSSNRAGNLSLPQCLESISTHILEFSGAATLRRVLKERLSQWADTPPEQDWWNRFCIFGSRVCEYREAHPHIRQWGQQTVHCHISDGQDTDRLDFREVVEEVLGRFDDVTYDYLDALSMCNGYDFLLCTHCQTVRSTPFAIYRITPHTAPETFISIGMSLALETQFSHAIPKVLLTTDVHDIPSLLTGYEVVVAHNDSERKTYLRKFMPQVIQLARKTTWKPRPLPFIEIVPRPVEKLADEDEQEAEQVSEVYIDTIGEYGVIEEIGRGSFAIVYRVRDTQSKQVNAMKVLYPELASDSEILARFQREVQIVLHLSDPHIVRTVDYGNDNSKYYIVMEYIDGQNLKYHIQTNGLMEPIRALRYIRQIAEGLDTAYKQGVVHRDINPQNILIDRNDEVKIIGFGLARGRESATLTQPNVFMGTAYYISPEQAESGRSADTRSDLYSVATVLFELLTGSPPFEGETAVDIVIKHMNEKVPSVCRLLRDLPIEVDSFMQKAMAKNPADRFATPQEFIIALDELSEKIKATPEQPASSDDLDNLIGKSLGQFRIIERISAGGMATVFKAYQPNLDRYVAIKVLPASLARDPNFVKRFVQEERAVAKLIHPNILQLHDFGDQDNITYIAMEYVEGGTLKDRLKRALSVPEAIDYMIQAAEGLDCAHRNGIIHSDVKPTNMLLRTDGYLLLSDFGIAKILAGTMNFSRDGAGFGTPQYMSPEQGTGQAVDRRSDIYSLGIVLFHCLVGRVPFNADNPLTIIVKHLNNPLPVELLRAAGVPAPIEQVVVKMTAKAVRDRYQTTDELITALTNAQVASHLVMPTRRRLGMSSTVPQLDDQSNTTAKQVQGHSGNLGQWQNVPNKSFDSSEQQVVTLPCPYCGAEIRPGDNFCLSCGNRVAKSVSQPQKKFLDYKDDNQITVPEDSYWSAVNLNEEPTASPAQALLEDIDYIGQTISSYSIEREIGRGGFGRVYRAQHIESAHWVAIKIFYAHLSDRQKRILSSQEMLLRKNLKHPYILPVLEVSLQQQPQYVISEYAVGGTLPDRLLSWQPQLLPLQEAIMILSQVGEALASIHQQGIIHRDLKPANILFNEQGEARLADFDLAIVLDAGDDTKRVDRTGSPPYMAPEQFEGIVSRYSDQYALSCIAYELFTGARAFIADNFVAMQFKHTLEQPLAPRLLNPELPAHIEQAILKALAKNPIERHTDIMAFVKELRGS